MDYHDMDYPLIITEQERNCLNKVKLLLQNGNDVNLKNKYGNTALSNALNYGYFAAAKLLLINGADLNLKDKYVDWAILNGDLGVVKLLNRKNDMEDWRPWNHCNFPHPYRNAMSTILLLAKS